MVNIVPVPITGFPEGLRPYNNITPFTYRDGLTYLEVLESLRAYIRDILVPHVDTEVGQLAAAWDAEVSALITTINAALTAQAEDVNGALSAQTAANAEAIDGLTDSVNASIADLTTFVNTAVASIIEGSIEAVDATTAEAVGNPESLTTAALAALYAPVGVSATVSDLADLVAAQAGALEALDTLTGEHTTAIADLDSNVESLNALVDSGRLSAAELDGAYANFERAEDYGIAADGVTDDSAAITAMLAAASVSGLTAQLAPNSDVYINATVVFPSNVRFDLNGSVITRGPTGSGVMFQLLNQSNIHIFNGTLDGNKAAYPSATEWRHNINLDNSDNIVIRDLYSNNGKGDGIYIGGTATDAHCLNISLDNVECDGNHRQGLSIIGVDGFTANNCRFNNTSGTAPQSGVDVEPNRGDQVCTNIQFINCTMEGNAGHGYLEALQAVRTAKQGGVSLIGCTLKNNLEAGARLTASEDFQMIGGSANGNLYGFWHNTNTMLRAKFIGVVVSQNKGHGFALSAPYSDLLVQGCTFERNAQTQVGDGLNIAPSSASSNFRFIGNYSGQSPQRNGLTLGANAAGSTVMGNSYGGNTGTDRSGTSAIGYDAEISAKRTVTGAKGGNAALTSLLTQLAGLGLITDSTS